MEEDASPGRLRDRIGGHSRARARTREESSGAAPLSSSLSRGCWLFGAVGVPQVVFGSRPRLWPRREGGWGLDALGLEYALAVRWKATCRLTPHGKPWRWSSRWWPQHRPCRCWRRSRQHCKQLTQAAACATTGSRSVRNIPWPCAVHRCRCCCSHRRVGCWPSS